MVKKLTQKFLLNPTNSILNARKASARATHPETFDKMISSAHVWIGFGKDHTAKSIFNVMDRKMIHYMPLSTFQGSILWGRTQYIIGYNLMQSCSNI